MAIADGAKGGLGNSSIKARRALYVDILPMVVSLTLNVKVKAGIPDQVVEQGLAVQGIVGGPTCGVVASALGGEEVRDVHG